MTREELKDLAISFYSMYNAEIEQTKTLLEINLTRVCMAYASANHLPKEAFTVKTQIKSLDSFLQKLGKKGWPQFDNPAAVINDFIGARITCWFLDDCAGILKSIMQCREIGMKKCSMENYILNPKPSGYRALHVLADISTAGPVQNGSMPDKMVCEIKIRTRLQDAWGDITHDLYYRAKHSGRPDKTCYTFLNEISKRLLREDGELLMLKDLYEAEKTDLLFLF